MTVSAAGRTGGSSTTSPVGSDLPGSVTVVGAGRLGHAMAAALRSGGVTTDGPYGRGCDGGSAAIVLLCVPDDQIAVAAAALHDGPFVGHCSGASGLSVLAGVADERRFSVHPLVTATPAGVRFAGSPAAVAGSSEAASTVARSIASAVGLRPFTLADADRAAYHAGAAMAANFLVTVEWAAARLLKTAGVAPSAVLPLARQALDNWADLGPAALTGPVARGDHGTVAAHRGAVAERTPDLLALFDELVRCTETLAAWKDPS